MSRTTLSLAVDRLTEVRTLTSLAADSSTLIDANIDPALALNCQGFESIFVGAEFVGGSSPGLTLEPLFRDDDAADGARWRRLYIGAPLGITAIAAPAAQVTPTINAGQDYELRVQGALKVFLRITTVANASGVTQVKILARPGRPALPAGPTWR